MKKPKATPELQQTVRVQAAGAAPWWPLPALLAVTLAVYLPAMNGPFLFDDLSLPILSGNAPADWMFYVKRVARSVFNLSLLADFRMWGLNPAPFHWVNWLLHAVNGWLVYVILRAWKRPYWLSLFGAGVFWLHPLQTEAVSYIASRSEGLSVLFGYAALALFLGRNREMAIRGSEAVRIILLMGLAVLSKESAAAMVGVFMLTDLVGGGVRRLTGNWRLYAPLVAGGAAAAAYIIRLASREGSAGFGLKGVEPLDYLWTQFQVIPLYIRYFLVPWGQNLDHAYPLAKAPGDALSWAGLVAIVALVYLSWRFRAWSPLPLVGLLSFLTLLAPTSSIVPIADTLVERRLYLPMIGLLLASTALLEKIEWNHAKAAGAALLLVALAGLTAVRNDVYTSSTAMWLDSVNGNPKNARAHFQLAYAYYRDGRCAEANPHYAEAAKLNKPDYELLVDWALSLDCAGDSGGAVEKLRQATELRKKGSHAWATLGMVYGKSGRSADALEALNRALSLNPRDANALAYRGNVYLVGGKTAEAIADFEAALRIAPEQTVAAQGLAAARAAQAAPR